MTEQPNSILMRFRSSGKNSGKGGKEPELRTAKAFVRVSR